ncbi:MAG: hypothetical protein Pg6A_13750 [Termitinemataceae bacterium]|nr:MAG: hypothetical protein Pg6A_13750 [Termitinemataceae bacterium]
MMHKHIFIKRFFFVIPAMLIMFNAAPLFSGDFPEESLKEVLQNDDFGAQTESWELHLRDKGNEGKNETGKQWIDSLLREFLARFLRIAAAFLVAALIIFTVIFAQKFKPTFFSRLKNSSSKTVVIKDRTVPQDIIALARSAFLEGRLRVAWTLLFAASVAALKENGVNISEDATETEALDILKKILPEIEASFSVLVEARIAFAYMQHENTPFNFEESAAFCESLIARSAVGSAA